MRLTRVLLPFRILTRDILTNQRSKKEGVVSPLIFISTFRIHKRDYQVAFDIFMPGFLFMNGHVNHRLMVYKLRNISFRVIPFYRNLEIFEILKNYNSFEFFTAEVI